jgi:hypothetical protein
MNLKEVDETLFWMREEWGNLGHGRKMVWGRLKKRQRELLGIQGGPPRSGPVVHLTVESAALLDEVRRLKAELQEKSA